MSNWMDQVLKLAGELPGGGISPVALFGKDATLTIGGVDVTKWIKDVAFTTVPGEFTIDMQLTLPVPPAPKPKPPAADIKGVSPQYVFYDEVTHGPGYIPPKEYVFNSAGGVEAQDSLSLLQKVAEEMIAKKKGITA